MSAVLLQQPSPTYQLLVHKHLTFCCDCGRLSCEYVAACDRCNGEAVRQVSDSGEIYSYTTVYGSTESFVLALVQLSGGPRVTGQIVGADRQLKIGLAVEFAYGFQPVSDSCPDRLFFSPLRSNHLNQM